MYQAWISRDTLEISKQLDKPLGLISKKLDTIWIAYTFFLSNALPYGS